MNFVIRKNGSWTLSEGFLARYYNLLNKSTSTVELSEPEKSRYFTGTLSVTKIQLIERVMKEEEMLESIRYVRAMNLKQRKEA